MNNDKGNLTYVLHAEIIYKNIKVQKKNFCCILLQKEKE